MTSPHLTSFTLEEIVTGERSREAGDVAGHLQACEQCRARLEALERKDHAFYEERPPAAFLESISVRDRGKAILKRRTRLYTGLGLAAAAACGLLVWMLVPWGKLSDSADDLQVRGSTTVQTLVVRSGTLQPALPYAFLPEGSHVRFRVQTDAAFMCIFHVCGDKVRPLHPGPNAMPSTPGSWLVPGTFELFETGARDRLVLILFDQAADCRQALGKLHSGDRPLDLAAVYEAGPNVVVTPLPRISPAGEAP